MKAPQKLTAAPLRSLGTLEWVGGHVALDFVNTVDNRTAAEPQRHLRNYEDLLAWCRQADLIGPVSEGYLSAGSPQAKAAAYKEGLALSDSLHLLFRAAARGEVLPQASLDHLNALVQKTVAWRNISACTDGARMINCGWNFKDAPPVAVLGPIVWRAMELLENGPLDRIKECPPPHGCGWLFLDLSKNRSRQWCSMKSCGNASKVRRFRERQKA
jgi:predicted RNA-binding Zn ribbon-like protein